MNGGHMIAEGERLIRMNEYLNLVGESRTVAYERIGKRLAPTPIKDGRATLFVLSEVQAYIERKIATSPRKR